MNTKSFCFRLLSVLSASVVLIGCSSTAPKPQSAGAREIPMTVGVPVLPYNDAEPPPNTNFPPVPPPSPWSRTATGPSVAAPRSVITNATPSNLSYTNVWLSWEYPVPAFSFKVRAVSQAGQRIDITTGSTNRVNLNLPNGLWVIQVASWAENADWSEPLRTRVGPLTIEWAPKPTGPWSFLAIVTNASPDMEFYRFR